MFELHLTEACRPNEFHLVDHTLCQPFLMMRPAVRMPIVSRQSLTG